MNAPDFGTLPAIAMEIFFSDLKRCGINMKIAKEQPFETLSFLLSRAFCWAWFSGHWPKPFASIDHGSWIEQRFRLCSAFDAPDRWITARMPAGSWRCRDEPVPQSLFPFHGKERTIKLWNQAAA